MIEISGEHIREAENLIIGGQKFDSYERIPFIKELGSCDLLAVPGSGKTSALLAKLYCLSKHLPFNNGSGILVLSHTNATVDEIEKHLKPICPTLFEFPNFIGTIQGFVNKFLANIACLTKYGSYISVNDNDIYENEAKKFYYSLKWSKKGIEPKHLINKLLGLVNAGQMVEFKDGCKKIIEFLKWFEFDIEERKLLYNNRTILKYESSNQPYYLEIENWKEGLYQKGILNFSDSFQLGQWYVSNFPNICSILQRRFKYLFIDEMQDLEQFQIDLIDKIFYSETSLTVIQRIGDINQSIYNSGKKVKVQADWKPRNHMYLNDSNRLTPEIAKIVNCFILDRQQDENNNPRFVVNGLRKLDKPIKPHLILYNNETIGKLESSFSGLIYQYSLNTFPEAIRYGFKIIGWNAKWDDEEEHNDKLRLENIFSRYKKEVTGNKETFDSLCKYLQIFDKSKKTLEAARKAILNAFIAVLRIEGKTYKSRIRGKEIDRFYSKNELINEIKRRESSNDYEILKRKLYECSFQLMIEEKFEEVYSTVRLFIQNELKEWFDLTINQETSKFIGQRFEKIINDRPNDEETSQTNIKIDIGTVHSEKGKTHCATMYVETSYHDYESKKLVIVEKKATKTKAEILLPNPLLGIEHKYRDEKDKFAKQTLKMMYVGFSRPTHLLCFAALKENIGENIQPYIDAGWEIIDLSEHWK